MILLSSHSLKQWGQPGENLGGVRARDAVPTAACEVAHTPGKVVSEYGQNEKLVALAALPEYQINLYRAAKAKEFQLLLAR